MKFINIILMALMPLFFIACNDDEAGGASSGPPQIEAVYTAMPGNDLVLVGQGTLNSMVNVRGVNLGTTSAIYFNGVQAYFNPTLVTNENIFVVVPEDAPVVSDINKIRIETNGGVAEYDFPLLAIDSFTTGNDGTGDTVTLTGGDFNIPGVDYQVLFVRGSEDMGNYEEREATIVSQTQSTMTVYVPEGTTQAFIVVNTSLGASTTSTSYGFNYPFYVDSPNSDWGVSGWSGSEDAFNTEQALGQFAVKRISEQWGGLTFFNNAAPPVFSEYTSLAVKIYAPEDFQTITFGINDFEATVSLNLEGGVWNEFVIPLAEFYPPGTGPDTISRLDFQASSEGISTFWVDDFGLL